MMHLLLLAVCALALAFGAFFIYAALANYDSPETSASASNLALAFMALAAALKFVFG